MPNQWAHVLRLRKPARWNCIGWFVLSFVPCWADICHASSWPIVAMVPKNSTRQMRRCYAGEQAVVMTLALFGRCPCVQVTSWFEGWNWCSFVAIHIRTFFHWPWKMQETSRSNVWLYMCSLECNVGIEKGWLATARMGGWNLHTNRGAMFLNASFWGATVGKGCCLLVVCGMNWTN